MITFVQTKKTRIMDENKYKLISSECEYTNISFIDDIEDIMKIISSNDEYEFYFRFREYFDGCLVQLEQLEKSDEVVSEWDEEEYEWEYENDEPEEREVGGSEDNFDSTNMFHKVSEVECITLYKVKSDTFRSSLINLINKHNPSYLSELIEHYVDHQSFGDDEPELYEGFLNDDSLNIDYDKLLYKQYLTEGTGFKVTWLRYNQGNFGGEQFEFGYLKKNG